MTTLAHSSSAPSRDGWLTRSEAWLDSKGKGAWIAAMILGFVFFWPIGLAILAYMIWSKRMFNSSCKHSARKTWGRGLNTMTTTGNSAFDAYKADTLRRLEQEQTDFENFLARLREAKDKSEFDQFLDERASRRDDDETGDNAA